MNVLFLTSTLPRFEGDHQPSFVIDQAAAWKKSRPRDNIFILAPHDWRAKKNESINNISIHRYTYFFPQQWEKLAYPAILPNIKKNPLLLVQVPFFLFFQFMSAYRLCRQQKIDLVYAHWIMPQGLIAFLIHRLLSVPFVLQNHSSDLKIFLKVPFGKTLARAILSSCDKIFFVNSMLKSEALDLVDGKNHEILNQKAAVLPMGVLCDGRATQMKPLYDFGVIGRLSAKKGIDLFLKAAAAIKQDFPDIKIVIAGEGEEGPRLKALARELNVNVDFTGFVTGTRKTDLMNQVRTFVFPSLTLGSDREGLPVALLEALAFGNPVIASTDTNIRLIPEWQDLKDSVKILTDPRNLESFSNHLRSCRNNAFYQHEKIALLMKRYNWANLIKEYFKALKLD